jgi:tRNA threonylcarbamoyl adenosine modification protein (Sua5/YciO/YrdC/YwlC family)
MTTIPLGEILSAAGLEKISSCLLADGVIAYPTDTLYGLGGNFFSPAAAARIDAMKGRGDMPYSVAVGNLAMIESFARDIPAIFYERLQRLLPGRITFLFKASPTIAPGLLKNSGKIGIRLPGLPPLLEMIEKTAVPLISTSANRSGQSPLNDPRLIAREFPDLDLLIDGGVLPPSLGSTLVDLSAMPPRILRHGDDLDKWLDAAGRSGI